MLNKKIISFLLVNTLPLAIGPNNAITTTGLTCSQFGPFEVGDSDQVINLTYFYSILNSSLIETMSVAYHGENVFYSTRTKEHQSSNTQAYVASFIVPIHDHLTEHGLDLNFKAVNYTTNRTIYENDATIFPIKSEVINPLELKDKIYNANPVKFSLSAGRLNSPRDSYDFSKIGKYIENNSYLYLDISNFGFTYKGDEDFTFGTCQLKFKDTKNLFPYYASKADGYKHIPITLINNNNEITFAYRRSFYYNKNTMQISDFWKDGFEKTDYFYLPLNNKEEIRKYDFIFELYDVGISKMKIEFTVKYETNKNIFGSSSDSEYWVEGGVRR